MAPGKLCKRRYSRPGKGGREELLDDPGAHLTASLAYTSSGFDLPMMDRFRHVTAPSFYRYGLEGESEAQFVDRLAEELEQLILAEGPETVAAFFAEPVQGAGGVIVPP